MFVPEVVPLKLLALILPEADIWPNTCKCVGPLPLNIKDPVISAFPLCVPSHSAVTPVNPEPSPEKADAEI